MNNDFPCICGHFRVNHFLTFLEESNLMCAVKKCNCDNFVFDNLKYMEKVYDKRTAN